MPGAGCRQLMSARGQLWPALERGGGGKVERLALHHAKHASRWQCPALSSATPSALQTSAAPLTPAVDLWLKRWLVPCTHPGSVPYLESTCGSEGGRGSACSAHRSKQSQSIPRAG